jgi:hypothetical protein
MFQQNNKQSVVKTPDCATCGKPCKLNEALRIFHSVCEDCMQQCKVRNCTNKRKYGPKMGNNVKPLYCENHRYLVPNFIY